MKQGINIEVVWNEYRATLKAFLHSKIANPDEIDDLLQEILIKTHKNLPTLKSEQSIKAWLFQIANHTIIDFYRKQGKAETLSADDLWYEEENHQAQQELSQCIQPFIKALPKESAELLTEIELNGVSQKELANRLGTRYSTLKSRIQKGRRQLRTLFEDCCHLSLDKDGVIIDFEPKSENCKNC